MTKVTVKILTRADLPSITQLHIHAFHNSALSKLGHTAVRRYYEWLLHGPHDNRHAIGAYLDERLVGFCFGGRYNGALTGYLRKNWPFLSVLLLTHPWYIATNAMFRERTRLALSTIWKFRYYDPIVKNVQLINDHYYGILSLAVDPTLQRQGIGHVLITTSVEEARRRRSHQINLTVDVDNNHAIQFYTGEGFEKCLINGEWTGKLVKLL